MLRASASIPVLAIATLLFGLIGIVAGLLDRSGRRARDVSGWWARFLLFTLGVKVEVLGRENVVAGPALYAANHGSALDIPILFAHLPVDFRIIHKRSLYLIPVLGLYLKVSGHVAIDRARAFRARKSLENASVRMRRGLSVVAFPEGTRSDTPAVRKFKRGSFLLALGAGVPVVPVSITGVKAVAPGGLRRLKPGTVRIVVHAPLSTAGRQEEDAAMLADQVHAVVALGCEAA